MGTKIWRKTNIFFNPPHALGWGGAGMWQGRLKTFPQIPYRCRVYQKLVNSISLSFDQRPVCGRVFWGISRESRRVEGKERASRPQIAQYNMRKRALKRPYRCTVYRTSKKKKLTSRRAWSTGRIEKWNSEWFFSIFFLPGETKNQIRLHYL